MQSIGVSLKEELDALTEKNRSAYLVELSDSMDITERMIEKYRSVSYNLLTEDEKEMLLSELLFAHDYLLEKVKYLEEERFKTNV